MPHHRFHRLALGCALAVATLGACTSPPAAGPPAAGPPAPSAVAAPSPADPCGLLTDQDVAAATGRRPLTHKAFTGAAAVTRPQGCQWQVSGTDVLADLQVFGDQPAANADSLDAGSFVDTQSPPPHIGDRSFWRFAGAGTGPQLVFVAHGAVYAVELGQTKGGGFTAADAADYRNRTLLLGSAILAAVNVRR